MRFLVILTCLGLASGGNIGRGGGGDFELSGGLGFGDAGGNDGGFGSGGGGQVYRHVYVHVTPDEPVESRSQVVQVPGGDKHVNIIFVKAPSSSSSQQTDIILPEQDEQKNVVYILLKKGEASSDITVRKPASKAPEKPQVYFIRYLNNGSSGGGGVGGTSGLIGIDSGALRNVGGGLSTQYGL